MFKVNNKDITTTIAKFSVKFSIHNSKKLYVLTKIIARENL